MIVFLLQTSTLDRRSLLRAMGRGLSEGDTGLNMWGLAGLAAGVLLVALILRAIVAWRREESNRVVRNPTRLFGELLKAVDLTPGQRRFMHQLARDAEVENPAVLLISPGLFDQAVDQRSTKRKMSPTVTEKSLIRTIRTKLYA